MLEARATITEGGRLLIPAAIRKALHLTVGEEVMLTVESGTLHVSTYKNTIQQAQSAVRQYNKKQESLTKALFIARKADASDEK